MKKMILSKNSVTSNRAYIRILSKIVGIFTRNNEKTAIFSPNSRYLALNIIFHPGFNLSHAQSTRLSAYFSTIFE